MSRFHGETGSSFSSTFVGLLRRLLRTAACRSSIARRSLARRAPLDLDNDLENIGPRTDTRRGLSFLLDNLIHRSLNDEIGYG